MLRSEHDGGVKNRRDRLLDRAQAIIEGRATGLGEPILWQLALDRDGTAMLLIANRATRSGSRSELGSPAKWFSPANLMYRAFQAGGANAAQNLALSYFNIGDLQRYRYWMRRSARAGDANSKIEVSRFEIRQPHSLARRLRRVRPYRRDGS